jgi:O-antigen/teichoic acid export membrane protein
MSKKLFVKNSIIMIALSIIQRVFGVVQTMLLARWLGPGGFGDFTAINNTAQSGAGMVRLGLDAAIHVNIAQKDVENETKGAILAGGFIIMFGLSFIGALFAIYASHWLAANVFGYPGLAKWFGVAAMLLLLNNMIQFSYVGLAGLQSFKKYAIVMSVLAFLSLGAVVLGAYFGRVTGVLVALVIIKAITMLALLLVLKQEVTHKGITLGLNRIFNVCKDLLKVGLPFYLTGLLAIPVNYWMQGALSKNVGIDALGFWRVISTVTAIVSFLPTSIGGVTVSALARVNKENSISDQKAFFSLAILNLRIIWSVSLIISLATCIVVPYIIQLLFGNKYSGAIDSAKIAVITPVSIVVVGAISNILFAQKKVLLLFCMLSMQSILFAVSGYFMTAIWGLKGYVLAELISYSVVGLIAASVVYFSAKKRKYDCQNLHYLLVPYFIIVVLVIVVIPYLTKFLFPAVLTFIIGMVIVILYLKILQKSEKEFMLLKIMNILRNNIFYGEKNDRI